MATGASQTAAGAQSAIVPADLGPLAWVVEESRKSLDGAVKLLKRFALEGESARGVDLSSVDTGPLRMARQHLHQVVGALDLVEQSAASRLVRGIEAAVQRFILQPERCTTDAVTTLERAGLALVEYVQAQLGDEPHGALGLFPQYRDVQQLAGAERIHPADLCVVAWRWEDPATPAAAQRLTYGAQVREQLDQRLLKIMRTGDHGAAGELCLIAQGLADGESNHQPVIFWKLVAGFFEAIALSLLDVDPYAKSAASRIVVQYAQLAKGDSDVPERLARDLLFFCIQAGPVTQDAAPMLHAIRAAWQIPDHPPTSYATSPFGLFDPAVLAQARRRVEAVKENWSALSGGELMRLKSSLEQLGAIAESLHKLQPAAAPLADALVEAGQVVARSARPPSAELAMEVATAILFLEASFAEFHPGEATFIQRALQLAGRLQVVGAGGAAKPLDGWMEELYRRVSDRQTMGTVVGELRATLGSIEQALDRFFRTPADKALLNDVPGLMGQMRGVLSVLGLEQAMLAVGHMREVVEQLLVNDVQPDQVQSTGTFERLGNNLGALGFLIDMLGYQPQLAKQLFVYDAEAGELHSRMTRNEGAASGDDFVESQVDLILDDDDQAEDAEASLTAAAFAASAPSKLVPRAPDWGAPTVLMEKFAATQPPDATVETITVGDATALDLPWLHAPAPPADDDVDDVLDIFLQEAREVVQNGALAIDELNREPGNVEQLTTLRRVFHTLKGSARMVGLADFGEGAWSMEQLLNAWLAERKPVSAELLTLSRDALLALAEWTSQIASRGALTWQAEDFQRSADALRLQGRTVALTSSLLEAAPPLVTASPETVLMTRGGDTVLVSLGEPTAPSGIQAAPLLDRLELPDLELQSAPPAPQGASEAVSQGWSGFAATVLMAGKDAPALEAELRPSSVAAPGLVDMRLDDGRTIEFEATPGEVLGVVDWAESDVHAGVVPATQPAAAESVAPHLAAVGAEPVLQVVAAAKPQDQESLSRTATALDRVDDAGVDASAAVASATASKELADAECKQIGDLQIATPLYNVYLSEAEIWSHSLQDELLAWAEDPAHRLAPLDDAIAHAHSLAGASATVGFQGLSELARALEHALQRLHPDAACSAAQASTLVAAGDEIRRVLHQFAAGMLKHPDAGLVAAVQAVDAPPALPEDESTQAWSEVAAAASVETAAVIHAAADLSAPSVAVNASAQASSDAAALFDVQEPLRSTVPPDALAQPLVAETTARAPGLASAATPPLASTAASTTSVTVTAHVDHHIAEGIDVADAIDEDLFPIFEEEADELLPQIAGYLRGWIEQPGSQEDRSRVLRGLHTLKGSARLAGALRLGEVAHRTESAIASLGTESLKREDVEPLLEHLDEIESGFRRLKARHETGVMLAEAAATTLPGLSAAAMSPVVGDLLPADDQSAPVVAARRQVALPAPLSLVTTRAAVSQAVRVRTQLLDRLVNQAGEVISTRTRLEAEMGQLRGSLTELTANLERLRQQLRDVEMQAETQMQSRLALSRDTQHNFDPLEFDRFTRMQELTRMMAESVNDVATVQRTLQRAVDASEDELAAQARQSRELQHDLLRTRMTEFEGLSERLYRVVRQASKETGKPVKLDIAGGSIEMDRSILDRMAPAFEHLLRNCVVHGIETADVRAAHGKDPTGTITIEVNQSGNDVAVEFRDDGAGLDVTRIRERALARGLITADQVLSAADVAGLIFLPGFSTTDEVTELAGRGVGMDVVRTEVQSLGGRIETAFSEGQGSAFRLILPLTTAVTHVVMVRAGDLVVGIPSNLVDLVLRASPDDLQQAYTRGAYAHGGDDLPFFWSGALLQSSPGSTAPPARTVPVMVLRSADQRVAMHVDEVLGNQEVVVKSLGPQLSRLPGLVAITALASGSVALIYNPVALAAVYGPQAREFGAQDATVARWAPQPNGTGQQPAVLVSEVPLVLVVDDSITVRRVTQRLLQREGFRVALAADGLQGLERLQQERPAVVLTDIEMPRMDGFDFVRNIRVDPSLADLPVIMITSRIAQKHQDHAAQQGVNHYLGKPYPEEELLRLIKLYAQVKAPAA